jgi:protein-disulfide isomerase
MEEHRQKGAIDNMRPKAAFKVGLLTGIGVMFVIGFFILLGMMLSGDGIKLGKSDAAKKYVGGDTVIVDSLDQDLVDAATKLGLDGDTFASCLNSGEQEAKVNNHSTQAAASGGRGTPHNVLIAGNIKVAVPGALPYASLKALIDQLLAGESPESADPNIQITPLDKENDWIRGNADGKVSIIEFSDIDCPYCARHHDTMKQLMTEYGDQISWVYRHFPLTQLHPDAFHKAEAAECAGELGGNEIFWQYLDILFAG